MTAFSICVRCPHCNVETTFPVDLEGLALSELEKIQHQLLRDIHQLAITYHWSETEILSLTPLRRAHYLKLIEEAAR